MSERGLYRKDEFLLDIKNSLGVKDSSMDADIKWGIQYDLIASGYTGGYVKEITLLLCVDAELTPPAETMEEIINIYKRSI